MHIQLPWEIQSSMANPTKEEKLGHDEVSRPGKQSEDKERFGRNRRDEDGECRSQSYEKVAKPCRHPHRRSSSSQSLRLAMSGSHIT